MNREEVFLDAETTAEGGSNSPSKADTGWTSTANRGSTGAFNHPSSSSSSSSSSLAGTCTFYKILPKTRGSGSYTQRWTLLLCVRWEVCDRADPQIPAFTADVLEIYRSMGIPLKPAGDEMIDIYILICFALVLIAFKLWGGNQWQWRFCSV